MIYLTRTTIELDGTRTTEIAVLEDKAWLKRYESQGFTPCTYETYREAWRENHTALYERLLWEAGQQAPPNTRAALSRATVCPTCASLRVTRQGGLSMCRACGRQWGER